MDENAGTLTVFMIENAQILGYDTDVNQEGGTWYEVCTDSVKPGGECQ
jgi:hypothetical protein